MSKKGLEVFVCDICKKPMHPVHETMDAVSANKEYIYTPKFDAHVKCFEKLILGTKHETEAS